MRGCLFVLVLAAALICAIAWFGAPPIATTVVAAALRGNGFQAQRDHDRGHGTEQDAERRRHEHGAAEARYATHHAGCGNDAHHQQVEGDLSRHVARLLPLMG